MAVIVVGEDMTVARTHPLAGVWSADAARLAAAQPGAAIAPFAELSRDPGRPDLDLWDMWHLTEADGSTVFDGGRSWWFFLATPRFPDPEARHDHARIRLL
ncbi:MAG TPA: glycoside hydrolase 68 family protein, partial [Sphingomonas bacterium]|nr:glycoside hydrolase 68 family protein [Sphingomonas bacterium]